MNAPPMNRIPGTAQTKEQYIKDLKTLGYHELLEIKDRQSNLLASKKRLQSLPDKGKRIQESYEKLLAEIQRRNDVEATANLFGELNIASKGKRTLNNLEWHGRAAVNSSNVSDLLDSDDEQEMDPLRVIAQGTMHQRQVKVLPPPATLITPEDVADIASFRQTPNSLDSTLTDQSASSSFSGQDCSKTIPAEIIEIDAATLVDKHPPGTTLEQHALYLIEKTELPVSAAAREKFRPFRTTISNVHDPAKERIRKKGKHWEITAATPPLIQHKETQLVPLAESASLQVDYMQKVKELRIQQAEERLARQTGTVNSIRLPDESVLKTKSSFNIYRDPQVDYLIEGRQRTGEQNEVHDPTILEKASGGVSYAVYK
ncbi:uncharacterized protein LOC115759451 [Drosophila novamexicana]|uniref:uncharacterized protein LOC115759451 n=1 Tax=Drosophila novamexicana TaxID=47314 RepID=UPI0011E5AAED|nr:uncharacterized protein LOC115759451 [Drosophila novamexicana]